jgi:hypothetical protein
LLRSIAIPVLLQALFQAGWLRSIDDEFRLVETAAVNFMRRSGEIGGA